MEPLKVRQGAPHHDGVLPPFARVASQRHVQSEPGVRAHPPSPREGGQTHAQPTAGGTGAGGRRVLSRHDAAVVASPRLHGRHRHPLHQRFGRGTPRRVVRRQQTVVQIQFGGRQRAPAPFVRHEGRDRQRTYGNGSPVLLARPRREETVPRLLVLRQRNQAAQNHPRLRSKLHPAVVLQTVVTEHLGTEAAPRHGRPGLVERAGARKRTGGAEGGVPS
mmetsp:Transcript_28173/g.64454  ORF Transcript_28173/g.64454 Transcript_28173/m.64454 type:complete len:219 (+) Transcript_28173:1481-2137(+)